MTGKIDVEALLEAYRQRLRAQIESGDNKEQAEHAYRIHSMFQEPAMRYLCEQLNAKDEVDFVRVGLNLSVAFATALTTYLGYVDEVDQGNALTMMMNNIYATTSRLMAEMSHSDPEKRLTVEEFVRPVN